jgi:hypothetical protein
MVPLRFVACLIVASLAHRLDPVQTGQRRCVPKPEE